MYKRQVYDRIVVRRVVIGPRPLAHDADSAKRRYPLKDAGGNSFEEFGAVAGLYRMRLAGVVASEHEGAVRALLEIRPVVKAEDHRAVKDLDRLRDKYIVAFGVDRKLHAHSRRKRRRPGTGGKEHLRRVPFFTALGHDSLYPAVLRKQLRDRRVCLYLSAEAARGVPVSQRQRLRVDMPVVAAEGGAKDAIKVQIRPSVVDLRGSCLLYTSRCV